MRRSYYWGMAALMGPAGIPAPTIKTIFKSALTGGFRVRAKRALEWANQGSRTADQSCEGGSSMTPEETNRLRAAARCIDKAERGLGLLARGERRDLLRDNFHWVTDSAHAGRILAAVEDMYPILRSRWRKFD